MGIPPMLYLAKMMAGKGFKRAVGFIGAMRADLLPISMVPGAAPASSAGEPLLNVVEFRRHGFPAVITTDDGSAGMKGYVTQALRMFLSGKKSAGSLAGAVVCCCGPTPMMKATAKVAGEFGVTFLNSLDWPLSDPARRAGAPYGTGRE